MAGNPFYVKPAQANLEPVMTGIGNLVKKNRAEAKRQTGIKEMSDVLQSGDPVRIADFSSKNPELQGQLKDAFGFTNKASETAARTTYRRVLADPDNAAQYLQEGIQQVSDAGGKPTMMTGDLDMIMNDPENAFKNIKAGYAGLDPTGYKSLFEGEQVSGEGFDVKSTKILDDGTMIQSTSQGPRVFNPSGDIITGKKAADAIRTAQEFGMEIQGGRSKSREVGKSTAKGIDKAIESAARIRSNNLKLKRVIDLVSKEGAETGPLSDMLPSLRASTIELKNLQKQLGLDVIGAVTFGALSKGELDLAMEVALPTNLDGPELIRYVKDKNAAQEKLAGYLEDQALYLGTPGASKAGWLQLQKEKRKQNKIKKPPPKNETDKPMTATAPDGSKLILINNQWVPQ